MLELRAKARRLLLIFNRVFFNLL